MHYPGFICYDGMYLHADEAILGFNNRAFLFGDAVSETMHAYATEVQFLKWHLEKLLGAMRLLSMEIPESFTMVILESYITKLLTKNKLFKGASVRLTVFRQGPESFIPQNNKVSFILDCDRLEHGFYELNSRGYVIGVFSGLTRHTNRLSMIKSTCAGLFLAAGIYARENGLDDCILLNEKNRIVESVHSNIFLVKDASVFTPGVDEGCIPGVLRRAVIEICKASGFHMNDQCSLSPMAMEEADEVFLTDSIGGIQWVGAFNQKRYYKKTIRVLVQKLNEYAFNKWLDG